VPGARSAPDTPFLPELNRELTQQAVQALVKRLQQRDQVAVEAAELA
jgi:hypothetical protein